MSKKPVVQSQFHSAAGSVRPLVVIPTRNRPDLAITAIKSVIQAGIPQVAVIVSDNSTEESYVTQLRNSVEALGHASISYIRPDRPMSMTDHWQWILDQVLTLSDWTHVAYLTDRNVFRDGALELIIDILHEKNLGVVSFGFDAVFDFERPVKYHRAEWTGWLYAVTSMQLLHLVASYAVFANALPTAMNCFTSRHCILSMRSVYGRCFENVAPDYNFAFKLLTVVHKIYYADLPLMVSHAHSRSNGWAQATGVDNPDSLDFQQHVGSRGIAALTAFPEIQTGSNTMFNEYLHIAARVPGQFLPPISQERYVALLFRDIAALRNRELAQSYLRVLSDAGYEHIAHHRGPFDPSIWMRMRRKFWYLLSGPATRRFWAALHGLTGLGVPYGGHFEFVSTEDAFLWIDAVPRARTFNTRRTDRLLGGHGGVRIRRVARATL